MSATTCRACGGYVGSDVQHQCAPRVRRPVLRYHGGIVEVHDSKYDALAAAKRLAAKEMDEYFVFAPVATVRPKPVDVEVVEG